jgi:hypothetical protein
VIEPLLDQNKGVEEALDPLECVIFALNRDEEGTGAESR